MPPKRRSVQVSTWSIVLLGAVVLLVTLQVVWQHQFRHASATANAASNGGGSGGGSRSIEMSKLSDPGGKLMSLLKGVPQDTGDKCHMETHNEYHGAVLVWGEKNLKDSPEECCAHCQETPRCTAWVYCPKPTGCAGRPHKECWLKNAPVPELFTNVIGKAHDGISWTSGAIYTPEQYDVYQQQVRDKANQEDQRRKELRNDEELPLVYLDVAIDGKVVGRIEMVLFMKTSPLAAENMRVFCSGEKDPKHHLKGAYFYRIIDRFIDQTGVETDSIYGGQFKDDAGGLKLQHDRPYLLSIANGGPNTNTAHFSITVAPAHHLDGLYVIFGECVTGLDTIERINALSHGQPNNELLHSKRVQIVDAGQLRRGSYRPPPVSP